MTVISKGPDESADGDHDNHLRHQCHNFIGIMIILGFGVQGCSEFSGTVSYPKAQTPSRGRAGRGGGGATTTEGAGANPHHKGEDTVGWRGTECLALLKHICICVHIRLGLYFC